MRDGKKKRETDYRTWPVWDNYRYAFLWLKRSEGCGVFAVLVVDVVLQVLVPFLGMALPSAVIGFLTGNRKPGESLLLICGYLLLFQILTLIGN